MRNLLTFAALLSLSVCSCGQSQSPANITQIGAASNPVVALLIPSAQIAAGGTFQFVATTVLQDNSNSVPAIGCAWTSSSPGVATINANGLATGVSVGSTTITCSVGSQLGTALLTVIATPSITSPTCGTPPCSLTGGVNGISYLYTLTAIGGILPYTWTCPATCNMPGWMSLNASTGALTGTAATGTSTFTIKVCDSSGSPLCTTLAVTLTVLATATCVPPNYAGPPLYPCGSNSSANPGQITYLLTSGTPAGIINTSNAAIAPCTANCMQWVSGDHFATSWNFGSSAGNGGNIQIGGGTGTVNATNSASGSCTANCVTWVSGNTFNGAWTKINVAGVSYTVGTVYSSTLLSVTHTTGTLNGVGYSVVGTTYGVSVWNSTTVATLMSAPGTQTGVTYLDYTACKAGTSIDSGNGCQNSTTEDNTIPGHVSGSNIVTRVSDGGTTNQGHSVGCLTMSCGDNDRMFSHPNGTYIYVVASGGFVQPYQLDTSTHKVQVVNSGCAPATFNPGGVFATSWLTETTFYYMVAAQIWQGSISGTGCSIAFNSGSMLVDLMGAGVCSGVTPFTVQWRSSLTLSVNDDTFSVSLSSAGQGTGDLEFAWSRTKGCSVANLNTGQVFCAAGWGGGCSGGLLGTMATGVTNCWGSVGGSSRGIHEALQSGDGNYVAITPTAPWNQGGCAGISGSAAGYAIWQLGTLGNQWCSNNASTSDNCGGHSSSGITHFISPSNYGYTLRSFSSVPSFTTFTDILPSADEHFAWPHNNNGIYDDTLPWVGNTDLVATAQLTGCTGGGAFVSAVYCPIWLGNVTEIIFPYVAYPPQKILTFTHTGACGYGSTSPQCADQIQDSFGPGNSIGTVSPKGDVWCWVSSIWHQTGWDYIGQPRSDVYCLYLGHP